MGPERGISETRFTRKVVDALNVIYGADSRIQLIDDLSNPSGNIFKIKKSRTNIFIETNKTKANKIQYMTDPVFSGIYNDTPSKSVFEGGSGREIMWNPNGTMISTTQGAKINPIVDLAHEINGTHFKDDYQQFKTESGLPVALLTLKK